MHLHNPPSTLIRLLYNLGWSLALEYSFVFDQNDGWSEQQIGGWIGLAGNVSNQM